MPSSQLSIPFPLSALSFDLRRELVNSSRLSARQRLGITRRELAILELMTRGHSNREMDETSFVSEITVKTHCSCAFDKLGARRRIEAVQRSRELSPLP